MHQNDLIGQLMWLNGLPNRLVPAGHSPLIQGIAIHLTILTGNLLCVAIAVPIFPLLGALSIGVVLGGWYFDCRIAGVDYFAFIVRTIMPHGLLELPGYLFLRVFCLAAIFHIWMDRSAPLRMRAVAGLRQVAPVVSHVAVVLLVAALLEWAGPRDYLAAFLRDRHGPLVPRQISQSRKCASGGAGRGSLVRYGPLSFESSLPYQLKEIIRGPDDFFWMFRIQSGSRRRLTVTESGPFATEETCTVTAQTAANRLQSDGTWESRTPRCEPEWPESIRYIRHWIARGTAGSVGVTVAALSTGSGWCQLSSYYAISEEESALVDLVLIAKKLNIVR